MIRIVSGNLKALVRWLDLVAASTEGRPDQPVLGAHVETWRDVLRRAVPEVEILERQAGFLTGGVAFRGVDRLDAAYAENVLKLALEATQRVGSLARANADAEALKQLEKDVFCIGEALETLALGVARPESTTDKGAN